MYFNVERAAYAYEVTVGPNTHHTEYGDHIEEEA
jgi:hypothetical protein